MIHLTLIFEDTQVVLKHKATDGGQWQGTVCDSMTGETREVSFSGTECSAIFAIALHNDGEPLGVDELYKIAEPAMAREELTGNLRLIP